MKHRLVVAVAWCALGACAAPEERDEARVPPDGAQGSTRVEIVAEGVLPKSESQTFPAEDPATGDLWFSVIGESFDTQTVRVARKTDSGWASPEIAPFSGVWGDRAPRFSPDGASLYVTSNRPRPGSSEAGDMNVWRLERTGTGWSAPVLVDSPVNSEASDIHPSITSSAVWVASNRGGGMGRSDLYRIGSAGEVEHLGPPLNDELSQPDLWVSPDETWMILAITDRPGGYGGDDLYVSRFENGAWSEPVNLGPEINTAEYEYGPWVTADGEHLLFTSHRAGPSNIYRAPIQLVREALESR
jgi:Tol biopolymer transport system component